MKKAWRWPLAGFVLGGLVGATFLTVNVVGASSPERRRRHGQLVRGDPAHAASARARRASRSSCATTSSAASRRTSPAGRARRRARCSSARPGRASSSSSRSSGSPTGFCPRRSRPGAEGSTTTQSSTTAAARPRRCRRRLPRPRSTSGRSELDDGRPGSGALRRDEVAVVGRLGAHLGQGRARRSGSTAARSSRGSGRRRSTSLRTAPSSCSTR